MTRATLWAWDISALFYAKTYGPLAHQLDEELFQFLGASLRGAVVADVGCGPGVVAQKLAARGAERVFALDVSQKMLDQIPASPRITPALGRVEDGVLKALKEKAAPAGFDLVLFKRSLYQDRPEALRVLKEAYAQLAPGGRICVIHPEGGLREYAFGEPARLRGHTPYHLFNRAISLLGVWLGGEKYALYTRAELLALLGEVAGEERVALIPSGQRAFNLAAVTKPARRAIPV
jgi:SAM-dependent methyltransferase